MWKGETELGMVRRHVRRGSVRVVRQLQLVAKLRAGEQSTFKSEQNMQDVALSITNAAHWVWPYLVTGFLSLAGFASILNTGWGLSLFNAGIKHRFDKKIDALRHEKNRELGLIKYSYDREIESLKSELSQATDRGIRSNEREYQALIVTWEKFIGAYHAAHSAIGGFSSIPDLQRMEIAELEEWLELSDLSPINRRFVRNASDKTRALSRVQRGNDLSKAQHAIWDAQETLRRQSVFIPPDIEKHIDNALAKLRGVWAENHVNFSTSGSVPLKDTLAFLDGGEALKNSLRDMVRDRVLHAPRPIQGG